MKIFRFFVLFMCAVLILTGPAGTVFAYASTQTDIAVYNANVARIAQELERKYNVTITYPMRQSGIAAVGPQTLDTLDTSLMFVTPALVREVSAFFQNRQGLH
ncbi:MAG: hypothetical protein FWH00_03650, partial [Oscillospiraceae bacterium]|nr:hypothetical protein [Oscillospiraceae bacterium]